MLIIQAHLATFNAEEYRLVLHPRNDRKSLSLMLHFVVQLVFRQLVILQADGGNGAGGQGQYGRDEESAMKTLDQGVGNCGRIALSVGDDRIGPGRRYGRQYRQADGAADLLRRVQKPRYEAGFVLWDAAGGGQRQRYEGKAHA